MSATIPVVSCDGGLFHISRSFTPEISTRRRSRRAAFVFRDRRVESRFEGGERGSWTLIVQRVHAVEERDVGTESCEGAEQEGAFALQQESVGEGAGAGDLHSPFAPVGGDGFYMSELCQ